MHVVKRVRGDSPCIPSKATVDGNIREYRSSGSEFGPTLTGSTTYCYAQAAWEINAFTVLVFVRTHAQDIGHGQTNMRPSIYSEPYDCLVQLRHE